MIPTPQPCWLGALLNRWTQDWKVLLQRTGGVSARCKSSTKPLQAPLVPNWTEGSHTHCYNTSTSTKVFYYQKICSLDHFSASWVNWQYLTAGAWAQAMPYLGETQVWGRSVWLWLSGVFTLGWKLQAWSQFLAHSWALFCIFLLAKKRQGNAKEQAPQQRNHNQNWFCWAEEQRACLLQNVAVSRLECRKRHILAQILVLAYCNLNILSMINTAE